MHSIIAIKQVRFSVWWIGSEPAWASRRLHYFRGMEEWEDDASIQQRCVSDGCLEKVREVSESN
jgi:hypothetical protein